MAEAPPVVCLGASAGGVTALKAVVAGLPHDLDAAVLAVLHMSPTSFSVLPSILTRAGALPAAHALDGEALRAGRIYVAPPDHHILVDGHHVRVTRGPHENGHRPAVDPLFRSAALSHGPSVVAVVLSGSLDDGAEGVQSVKKEGGITIAQDPDECLYPAMPEAAIRTGAIDHVLSAADIARRLTELDLPAVTPSDIPLDDHGEPLTALPDAEPTDFSCPACGGVLPPWRDERGEERYRCHTGHRYSLESLADAQTTALDEALWGAYRALREQADLCQRIARRVGGDRNGRAVDYLTRSKEAERRAGVLRNALLSRAQSSGS